MRENIQNKNHWYDGRFYDLLIAPNMDAIFRSVKPIIHEGSVVLDLGCGTGRLVFQLAESCSRVDGIDLSIRNVEQARQNLRLRELANVSFYHDEAGSFLRSRKVRYNYAVMTFVLHEIDSWERKEMLHELSQWAEKIIIADYLFPRRPGFRSLLDSATEFAAGRDHYLNFRSFMKNGGIGGLAEAAGLKIVHEIRDDPPARHIAVLTK